MLYNFLCALNVASKYKLKILLTSILLIQMLALVGFISHVKAPTYYYVHGKHDGSAYGTRGRMYIDEQFVYDFDIVASCVFLYYASDQWIACGFFQGLFTYNESIDVDEPWYYWDWCIFPHNPKGKELGECDESYNQFELQICDTGEETWMSFTIGSGSVDYSDSIPDVYFAACTVWGQGKSHFSGNDMDFHHKYMKYMDRYYSLYDYDDTTFYANSPYDYYDVSDTEWYSYK